MNIIPDPAALAGVNCFAHLGLKILRGRIIELHVKDLNEKSKDAYDVIWGTGTSNIGDIMKELKSQNF